ncbi:oxidoreductase [Pseudomonas resinovorans]|uniref:oxidoreductase n=1 Tax=Metapseudomonas resinovorans TaxID=53412 RepID=UPI00237F3BF7|nr:oxidoreductase [Pseudomonas resinovorans]MDE3738800.1 oxidoreductase [Pseudomonas resinovorans]
MPRSRLFEPLHLGRLQLANRIMVGPMCQYSAEDGCMSDWHLIHLGQLALSGAALLVIETTAVSREGRISHADVGLWNDRTQAAIALTLESIRRWSDIPIAIELSHAGRKASMDVPWRGGMQRPPGRERGWQAKAPSSLSCRPGQIAPKALDRFDLQRIREGFAKAAMRASRAGIDAVQINIAQGYLLHQFLSPLTNQRADRYGGSLPGRMRFPLEVFDQVRDAFPASRPIFAHLCASDDVEVGWTLEQALILAKELEARGCSAIQVSSGGIQPLDSAPAERENLESLARALKAAVAVPVAMTSPLTGYQQVEALVSQGTADLIAMTHTLLNAPRWPWLAAHSLGGRVWMPVQYTHGRAGLFWKR